MAAQRSFHPACRLPSLTLFLRVLLSWDLSALPFLVPGVTAQPSPHLCRVCPVSRHHRGSTMCPSCSSPAHRDQCGSLVGGMFPTGCRSAREVACPPSAEITCSPRVTPEPPAPCTQVRTSPRGLGRPGSTRSFSTCASFLLRAKRLPTTAVVPGHSRLFCHPGGSSSPFPLLLPLLRSHTGSWRAPAAAPGAGTPQPP